MKRKLHQYNKLLSFVLFGVNVKVSSRNKPYYFRILSMAHHRISSLYLEDLKNTSFEQLYILIFPEATEIRVNFSSNC